MNLSTEIDAIRNFCKNPTLENIQKLSKYTQDVFLQSALEVVRNNFGTERTRTPGNFVVAHRILNILIQNPTNVGYLKSIAPSVFKDRLKYRKSNPNMFRSLLPPDDGKKMRYVLNSTDGNCFFQSISDAYMEIGRYISVSDLRNLLKQNASEQVFNEIRAFWISQINSAEYADYLEKKKNR